MKSNHQHSAGAAARRPAANIKDGAGGMTGPSQFGVADYLEKIADRLCELGRRNKKSARDLEQLIKNMRAATTASRFDPDATKSGPIKSSTSR